MTKSAESEPRTDAQFAVNDETRAKSLDDENEQERLHGCFVQWAVPKFGERRGVCIVLDKYRQIQAGLQDVANRHVVPFQIRRADDRSRFPIDQPGKTDAHGREPRTWKLFRDHMLDRRGELFEELFRFAFGKDRSLLQDATVEVAHRIDRIGHTDVDRQHVKTLGVNVEVFWRATAARWTLGPLIYEPALY